MKPHTENHKKLDQYDDQSLDQGNKSRQLSGWILVWFYVTAVICTWDATFIMLRPYTLPGGSLAWFWYFYKYYVTVDQRYQDVGDAFVFAQSLLNYVEVVVNIITIFMHYRQSRHTATTAFMVSVMTFWKTVLYFLMFSEFCTGGVYRHGNTFMQEFFLVVIPNIIWIFLPAGVMYALWEQLTPDLQARHSLKHKAEPVWAQKELHVNGNYGYSNGVTNGVVLNGGGPNKVAPVNGHANGFANGGVVNRRTK